MNGCWLRLNGIKAQTTLPQHAGTAAMRQWEPGALSS